MAERTKKSEPRSDLASVSLGELIHRCSPRVKGGCQGIGSIDNVAP
jgi:hypothetical protein